MRFSIRYQFMVPLVVVAVASLAAISAYYARRATVDTRSRVEQQLQGVAAVLADSGFPLTDAVLSDMSHLVGADFLLLSAGGRPIASSRAENFADLAPLEDQAIAESVDDVTLGSVVELDGQRYFLSSMKMKDRRGGSSSQVLHMLFPQGDYNTAWRAAFLPPLVVGLVAVLGVVLTTQLVAARINRVLNRLGGEVERLADGDFSPVEVPGVNDETQDLSVAVNRTAQRLADYEAETRRTEQMRTLALLGSGLAHEMRNAATGCRMAVELHSEACASSADDDSLPMALQQLKLMESQLQKYLRLGKPAGNQTKTNVDFTKLVDELIKLVEPSTRHASIDVHWQPPEGKMTLEADAELLSQAVMNLLLNATAAASRQAATTGTRGYVRAELESDSENFTLLVSDSGAGPPPELADSLFEPFVSDKPEGVGLGLAVTREVAETCGGSLTWQRVAEETQFLLCVPMSSD